ncbi:MAG: annexin [Candidatus Gastranaerophilales bacterium]|nr:annexin [Candidatus Gastranaerophilales bacterium]
MSKDYSSIGVSKAWLEQKTYGDKVKDSGAVDDGILTLNELESCGLEGDEKKQLISDFLSELGMSEEEYNQFTSAIEEETANYESEMENVEVVDEAQIADDTENTEETAEEPTTTTSTSYWSDGKPKETITYNEDGSVASKETFAYGTGDPQETLTYDSKGNITGKTWYDNGKEKYTYEYNEDGSYIYKTPKDDGSGEYNIRYYNQYGEETDANGNVIKTTPPSPQSKPNSSGDEAVIDDNNAERYAERLHDAMDGWGTDDGEVKEVLSELDGADLAKVAAVYEANYGESLVDAIKGDFSFGTEKTYVAKIEAAMALSQKDTSQVISEQEAYSAAEQIYNAVDGWGTDESAVSSVINGYNHRDLKIIAAIYEQNYGESLRDAIDGDFSGNDQDVLLDKIDEAMAYTE